MPLVVGDILHRRYRILNILGQGGMGSVYRAQVLNLNVDVAVKENLFTTADYAAQFKLEATLLANLRHANLPRVTDHFVLEEEGQYLVMDYIEGEDLRQILERRGALPEGEVVRIGVAMCDALSYLHSRTPSILHRDIKLGNVKITPDGGIFLVDFGLAKVMQGDQPTMTAARAMTPGYSPPEQYGSARTDARSDIYSLGATLYAAITGFIPEDSLARAIDGLKLTPLLKRNPKISPLVAQTIEKALETTSANRFQSAEEFRNALLGVQIVANPLPASAPLASADSETGPAADLPVFPSGAAPVPGPRRAHAGMAYLVLAVMLAIFGGLMYTNHALAPAGESTPTPSVPAETVISSTAISDLVSTATLRPSITPPPLPSATFSPTPAESASPTLLPTEPIPPPDGSGSFVFVSTRQGTPEIYLSVPGGEAQPLFTIAEGACQPTWSPDGKRLAYITPCAARKNEYANASIVIYEFASGQTTLLPTVSGGDYAPAFSPDGAKIVFTSLRDGYAQIYVMDLATQTATRLLTTAKTFPMRQPAWSPDGTKIAYAQMRYGSWAIWTVNADGTDAVQLIRSGAKVDDIDPVWLSDGKTMLFTQSGRDASSPSRLMRFNLETNTSEIVIASLPVDEISISPGGGWLLFRSSDGENLDIYQVDLADLTHPNRLTEDAAEDFDPAWRP